MEENSKADGEKLEEIIYTLRNMRDETERTQLEWESLEYAASVLADGHDVLFNHDFEEAEEGIEMPERMRIPKKVGIELGIAKGCLG